MRRYNLSPKRQQGFTLVELVTVIALLAIIATLIIGPLLVTATQRHASTTGDNQLAEEGHHALKMIERDLRNAIPGSIRIYNNGIEMILADGGVYYTEQARRNNNNLVDNTRDTILINGPENPDDANDRHGIFHSYVFDQRVLGNVGQQIVVVEDRGQNPNALYDDFIGLGADGESHYSSLITRANGTNPRVRFTQPGDVYSDRPKLTRALVSGVPVAYYCDAADQTLKKVKGFTAGATTVADYTPAANCASCNDDSSDAANTDDFPGLAVIPPGAEQVLLPNIALDAGNLPACQFRRLTLAPSDAKFANFEQGISPHRQRYEVIVSVERLEISNRQLELSAYAEVYHAL